MDLNTVIFHLDNFVDTWEGWGKVAEGVASLFDITGNLAEAIKAVA
ncbi:MULTISPECIES: hypothetical protein [unclassified Corynebacterium]|nr:MULTISPECIES: hypothetical protein [unclassified Corynebacterium]MDN8594201.1 hypothetical protein [Corynebacterium sp. P4_F2]WKK55076.1 hypothetical protein QYR03_07580 [Corynebacterium sp. P4-C1]WKK62492.1 hypothetical protein QYR04_06305 [Corynebacterium sp. P8-C1]